jgi:hypothetical protein
VRLSFHDVDMDSLSICPVEVGGTEERSSTLLVETVISFHILRKRQGENLAFRRDPLQDSAFEAFSIVASGTGHSFANLQRIRQKIRLTCNKKKAYQLRNNSYFVI